MHRLILPLTFTLYFARLQSPPSAHKYRRSKQLRMAPRMGCRMPFSSAGKIRPLLTLVWNSQEEALRRVVVGYPNQTVPPFKALPSCLFLTRKTTGLLDNSIVPTPADTFLLYASNLYFHAATTPQTCCFLPTPTTLLKATHHTPGPGIARSIPPPPPWPSSPSASLHRCPPRMPSRLRQLNLRCRPLLFQGGLQQRR